MKKQAKKAFTLVELLVVIAILAILATVSIVGYSNFTKKANLSNDNTVITELNRFVDAYKSLEKEIYTVSEAQVELEESGFDLSKIKASSKGYHYAYDIVADKFTLLDETFELVEGYEIPSIGLGTNIDHEKLNVYAFVTTESDRIAAEAKGYSTYLQAKFDGTTLTGDVTKGIDIGKVTNVSTINYVNTGSDVYAQNVIIKTNADNLTLNVNDASSTGKIYHYGVAGYLNIIDCAPCSYYENGEVQLAKISTGRIVLEEDSNVERIHFATTEGVFDNIIVAYDSSIDLPEFSRDAVTIGTNGVLVVELQKNENDSDYIWLYNQGTLSQVAIVNQEITGIQPNGENLEGVVENADNIIIQLGVVTQSQEMREAASQIANVYTGSNKDSVYAAFENVKDAPVVNKLGEIQGEADINAVSEGAKDITTEIQKATCQHENLPEEYSNDENQHYKTCPDCEKKLEIGDHDSDGNDNECSVCGYSTGKKIKTFNVTDNASLQKAFDDINAETFEENELHHEYKIVLPAGDFGATYDEENKGYIANVYIIKQYPTWNGEVENTNLNGQTVKGMKNATITIVGSEKNEQKTTFRGIFVVVGHGNSKSDWEVSSEVAATTFSNIVFNHTDLIGTNNGGEKIIGASRFANDDWGCKPIIGCLGSQNITIKNCGFINTGRINIGNAQSSSPNQAVTQNDGIIKIISTRGYSYNPTITNCTFDNIVTICDGYFHGEDGVTISSCTGTAVSFITDQGGAKYITVTDCILTFTTSDSYLFRFNNRAEATFTNCTFNRNENSVSNKGVVVVRGEQKSTITFTSCIFSGDTKCYVKGVTMNENSKIIFNNCTGINIETVGTSIEKKYFEFNE